MENENLIYIKLEYLEALESRKDVLNVERNLLLLKKIMNDYNSLRSGELNLKLKLHQKMKSLLNTLNYVEKTFPMIEHNQPVKEQQSDQIPIKQTKTKPQKTPPTGIDAELRDIQEKLKSLGQE